LTLELTRRRFIVGSALAGGGLLIGCGADRLFAATPAEAAPAALNHYVHIGPDGIVTVLVPRSDMGQGIYSALALIVAEELDADWSKVRVERAPVANVYANMTLMEDSYVEDDKIDRWVARTFGEMLGLEMTGGSASTREGWRAMRIAGSRARAMLVAAAAKRLGVAADKLRTENGFVLGDGARLSYGELAGDAALIVPPERPPLKAKAQYKLIGKAVKRLDIPAKTDGSARYGIDVRLDKMLYAAMLHCPVFGGKLRRVDEASIKGRRGVSRVVAVPGGVAVVADSYWRAREAAAALAVEWDEGPNAGLDSDAIASQLARDMESGAVTVLQKLGDAEGELKRGVKTVEATYKLPFLAHATMEPMNATALLEGDRLTIWTGTQGPDLVQRAAADLCGLSRENVLVNTTLLGGGFGRRIEIDFAVQAAAVAKAMPGTPVKLLWSREEDMRHDAYRPTALSRFRAALDKDGVPLAWINRQVVPPVVKSFADRNFSGLPFPTNYMFGRTPDVSQIEGSADLPYAIAGKLVEYVPSPTPVPIGFWRSVGHSYNGFFVESFVDELAAAAGRDPVEFRRALLKDAPRWLKVLDMAAEQSGWGAPLPKGSGHGIAIHAAFKSIVAEVAEVTVDAKGALRLDKVTCAIDCGSAIHPDTVVGQMESGIIYGLTAALYGEITVKGGRVVEDQFSSYPMVMMADAPEISVHIVESGAPLGGVGEPGTPPIAAALANAIHAATGKRIRELPLAGQQFV
jgi:isoquinoline 1-oxidoreductase subunit beta